MKKKYMKPEIMFESFTLSANIAGNCEIKINTQTAGTCGYPYEGGNGQTLFTEMAGTKVCNIPMDDDETNGFCYHVPIESNSIFNS